MIALGRWKPLFEGPHWDHMRLLGAGAFLFIAIVIAQSYSPDTDQRYLVLDPRAWLHVYAPIFRDEATRWYAVIIPSALGALVAVIGFGNWSRRDPQILFLKDALSTFAFVQLLPPTAHYVFKYYSFSLESWLLYALGAMYGAMAWLLLIMALFCYLKYVANLAALSVSGNFGRSFNEPRRENFEPKMALTSSQSSESNAKGDNMESIIRVIANGPTFVVLYVIAMIPTYLLPYLGSNSAVLNATGKAAGAGFSPAFWLHLICLLILCLLAWARGSYVAKQWLVIFPIMALIFDLVGGLNFIPFVPTVMHLCAIIVGVSSQKAMA